MRRIRRQWHRIAVRLRRRLTAGLGLSLVLHGALIALLLMRLALPRPASETHLLVDLVHFGEGSDGSAAGTSPRSQDDATVSPVVQPQRKAPQRGVTAPEDVGELLRRAELTHGTLAPATDERGIGGEAMGAHDGRDRGGGGGPLLKDFIRAQVERRWQFDGRSRREFVVQIRLRIDAGGAVRTAEIVEDRADPEFHAAAIGARNAALLSSPLQLPPGVTLTEKDVTVDLNTKDALR